MYLVRVEYIIKRIDFAALSTCEVGILSGCNILLERIDVARLLTGCNGPRDQKQDGARLLTRRRRVVYPSVPSGWKPCLRPPRAPVWMGIGSIIKQDGMKISQGVGFEKKMALRSRVASIRRPCRRVDG